KRREPGNRLGPGRFDRFDQRELKPLRRPPQQFQQVRGKAARAAAKVQHANLWSAVGHAAQLADKGRGVAWPFGRLRFKERVVVGNLPKILRRVLAHGYLSSWEVSGGGNLGRLSGRYDSRRSPASGADFAGSSRSTHCSWWEGTRHETSTDRLPAQRAARRREGF